MVTHPWAVQAPPWRSGSAPVLQKYAGTDFVDRFRAAPDQPLKWSATRDVVQDTEVADDAFDADGNQIKLGGRRFKPSGVRKLFQPMHARFYLVVCELVCAVRGRPPVGRDQISEAFFVVRRRREVLAAQGTAEGARLKGEILRLEADRQAVKASLDKIQPPGISGSIPWKALRPLRARRDRLDARLAALTRTQDALAAEAGTVELLEGWIPSEHADFGQWLPVDGAPTQLEEAIFPLYPLIPDPRAAGHPAAGRCVWYGVVPATSRDFDPTGEARFDSLRTYEIRCAFRRRQPDCPRGDRSGELVWSDPSAAYRLAAPFDPHGAGQRPVTIEMPDFKQLEAAAGEGCQGSVRIVTPPGSIRSFDIDVDDGKASKRAPPGLGGLDFGLEFMSIPLITIIAKFVLQLFMPIVMFIMGLFWMLRLSFAIPASLMAGIIAAAGPKARDAGIDMTDAELECHHAPPDLTADLEYDR